jgi:outer membrane protein assembly factor BamB
VYAVNAESNQPIWPVFTPPYGQVFDTRSGVTADLKADDAGLYVPTVSEGRLYCLNRTNGSVKWQWTGTGALTVSPVVTTDTVYQTDPNLGMVAIDKQEGPDVTTPQFNRLPGKGVRWSLADVKQVLAQDDKYTYALRRDNVIVALDKRTGETQFTSRRKDFHTFATNPKDGTVYAATKGGRVVAVKGVFQPGQVGEVVRSDERLLPVERPGAVALAAGTRKPQ